MSDLLRQDGKLWVVIIVIAVVFTGLIYCIAGMNQRINWLKNGR
ncbi:CcmD family protein [Dyadobacter jiangsuensis]